MALVLIHKGEETKEIRAEVNTPISTLLELGEHSIDYPCAQKGICKKCLVKATGELSLPSKEELEILNDDTFEGFRLACVSKIMGDCEIFIEEEEEMKVAIVKQAVTNFNPYHQKYGIAVDVGTTTLAISLYENDKKIETITQKNPQITFGADVISRIEAQMAGKIDEIADCVVGGMNEIISILCERAKISENEIDSAVITGNTTMLHLLTKHDCNPLSHSPFEAEYLAGDEVYANEIGLNILSTAKIYLPKCFSAFVGADISTAILATKMCNTSATSLLIDIGTNGEMALWHNDSLSCCSTAAGPAFEGVGIRYGMHGVNGAIDKVEFKNREIITKTIGNSPACGICGSGVIDCVAVMIESGVLDETGMIDELNEEYEDRISEIDGDSFFEFSNSVGICGKDIRAVQLAKSAICSGAQTLLHEKNITANEIEKVYIAGGFGSFVNIHNAGKIGLIPEEFIEKVEILGNAALLGAEMLLLNRNLQSEINKITSDFDLTDLAASPFFMDAYVDNMYFE